MFATIGYWICIPFAALLRLFYNMTSSYGVSLILFTLVIKLILLPFQMKSKKSMIRMSRMNGRIQEIQKRYANNQSKMMEETQKLYAEEGVSPMSGCLWSFIPLPILMALYYIIREPIVFFMNFGGRAAGTAVVTAAKAAIESAGINIAATSKAYEQIAIVKAISSNTGNAGIDSFLAANPNWVNVNYQFLGMDLSALPSSAFSMLKSGISWAAVGLLLIPLVSCVLQFLMMKVSMKDQPQTASTATSNKMMMWTMPLFSLWIGYTLPAALGVYWVAQSAFSAIQEFLLSKFYNGKLTAEEDEHQRQVEETRRVRQEEAKRKQEEQRQISAKQRADQKKKAAKAAQESGKGKKASTTENGRVGERPYARGRAFDAKRYADDPNGANK